MYLFVETWKVCQGMYGIRVLIFLQTFWLKLITNIVLRHAAT